ncbi:hypothetical protein BKA70DRAFT_1222146 [Coprinopsis sp. MPI-PUGE-AT-0042]|nr:hypothetical protein BKA70DRAFT_1222146 [Coprinopsis sp. MPI-PUGE-AT-0042]
MSSFVLHSPNDQIVGTPFATHCGSAPFEYPFLTSPVSSSSSLPLAGAPASSNSSRPPSPGIPHPPPAFSPSSILSDPTNTLALSLAMGVPTPSTSSDNGSFHPSSSTANSHHHQGKMRMASAPVPPGLIKRRRERAATAKGVINGASLSNSSSRRGSCGNSGGDKPQRPLMPDTGLRMSEA